MSPISIQLLILIVALSCHISCKPQSEVEFPDGRSKKKSASKDTDKNSADQSSRDSGETGDKDGKNSSGKKGSGTDDKESSAEDEDANESEYQQANGDADTSIEYPTLEFSGKGTTTCNASGAGDMATFTKLVTNLDEKTLDIDMVDAKLVCGGSCTDKATSKIRQSIGATVYQRVSARERRKLKESGFEYGDYAIFANSVTSSKGHDYQFSKPIPVFPWPAPRARYNPLEDSSKSWTTSVTGASTFTMTVKLSLENPTSSEVQVVIETQIDGDAKLRAEIYENFPMARIGTYKIETGKRIITNITTNQEYWGNDSCKSNRVETSNLNYGLCKKTKNDESNTYSCDNW